MGYEQIVMRGKYVLLTGATSGIGRACAHELARMGATVTIICRDEIKGKALMEEVVASAGNDKFEILIGDLGVQADIRRMADEYLASGKPIHVLLNNAAVVNVKRQVTVDGIEAMFATNHLAYFLLTNLLMERIKESAPARIVNVASSGHGLVKDMGFDDIQAERFYKTFKIYGRSKLGNILFTRELAERLRSHDVTVNALHPGAVSTGLGAQNYAWSKALLALLRPFFRSPEQGAATSLYVATAEELNGITGKYFADCKQANPKPWALDAAAARRLWALSEEMTGFPRQS